MIKLDPRLDTQQPAGKTFSIIHIITIMAVERGGGRRNRNRGKSNFNQPKIALFPVFLKRNIYKTFYILHYDYIHICMFLYVYIVCFVHNDYFHNLEPFVA